MTAHYYQDLSTAEAAEKLQTSESATRKRLQRVREALKGLPHELPNNLQRLRPMNDDKSIDVDTASYPNIRRHIEDGQGIDPNAVRIEEMINYFDYSYAGRQAVLLQATAIDAAGR